MYCIRRKEEELRAGNWDLKKNVKLIKTDKHILSVQ